MSRIAQALHVARKDVRFTRIAMLLVLYRRRDVGRAASIGAAIVVGATFVVFEAIGYAHNQVPTALRTTQIALDRATSSGGRFFGTMNTGDYQTRLVVQLTLTSLPRAARVHVQIDSAFLHLGDGSVARSARVFGHMGPNRPMGALPDGIRRFGSTDDQLVVGTNLGFDTDSAAVAAKRMTQLDVWTRVFVAEAVPLASTRVGKPLDATVEGSRLRISDDLVAGLGGITLNAATVGDARRSSDPSDIGLAVINETTREGIVLTSSAYSNSSVWMILPGAPVMSTLLRLDTNRPETEGSQIAGTFVGRVPLAKRVPGSRQGEFPEPAWYSDAKVVAIR